MGMVAITSSAGGARARWVLGLGPVLVPEGRNLGLELTLGLRPVLAPEGCSSPRSRTLHGGLDERSVAFKPNLPVLETPTMTITKTNNVSGFVSGIRNRNCKDVTNSGPDNAAPDHDRDRDRNMPHKEPRLIANRKLL